MSTAAAAAATAAAAGGSDGNDANDPDRLRTWVRAECFVHALARQLIGAQMCVFFATVSYRGGALSS